MAHATASQLPIPAPNVTMVDVLDLRALHRPRVMDNLEDAVVRNSVLKRRRRRAQAIESSPSAESLEDVVEVESDTPRKAARVVVVDSGDEGDGEEPTQRQATQRSPSRAVWEEQMRAMTKEQLEPQGSEDEDETEGEDEESLGGFIVEDEEGHVTTRGAEDRKAVVMNELHLLGGYQDEADAFKVYLQYVLLDLIDPDMKTSLARPDMHENKAYFDRAIDRVEGKVGDLMKLCAGSSAWMSAASSRVFLAAMHQLPGIELSTLEEPANCEICGRDRHPAIFEMCFHGRPCPPPWARLAPSHGVAEAVQRTIDEDEEAADLAEGTRGLTTHCFSVGRFCKIRVSTYHALFHYRTHLARWLRSRLLEVRQEGVELDARAVESLLDTPSLVEEAYAVFQELISVAVKFQDEMRGNWRAVYHEVDYRQSGLLKALVGGYGPDDRWLPGDDLEGGHQESTSESTSSASTTTSSSESDSEADEDEGP